MRLTSPVINKKIELNINKAGMRYLKSIASRKIDPEDRKIILVEDI